MMIELPQDSEASDTDFPTYAGPSDDLLVFNGIDAATGRYALDPMAPGRLAEHILGRPTRDGRQPRASFPGDPRELAETGWAVVFPEGVDPAIRDALEPLLALRRRQASEIDEVLYQEWIWHPGMDARSFLEARGVDRGPIDPLSLAYYVLLVGGAEKISWEDQYALDVSYAVGRLDLASAEEYSRYAATVVAAQEGRVERPRRSDFFGVRNADDRATLRTTEYLVQPLASHLVGLEDFRLEGWLAEGATKERLGRLLAEAPAFLFAAAHGLAHSPDHPDLERRQGALLCSDWPGPAEWGERPIPEDHAFAGDDLAADADVAGLVAFLFACYGAGTPRHHGFALRDGGGVRQVRRTRQAPRPLTGHLPRRIMAHPRGGALAVIGHVDRAWTSSFLHRSRPQLGVFKATLERLLAGWPVGAAMNYFDEQYSDLAVELAALVERERTRQPVTEQQLISAWTAHNDARCYVVLGDPAVRLAAAPPSPEPDPPSELP